MIDEGSYTATVIAPAAWVQIGQKQTPAVELEFEIDGGQKISWTGWLTDAARERTGEALAAAGYDGAHDESVRGKRCNIVVKHETYEGTTRAKVAWVNDIDRPATGGKPMSAVEKQAAKEAIRGLVLRAKSTMAPSDKPLKF